MTQIISLMGSFMSLTLLIEQRHIASPRGRENTRVRQKSFSVPQKPSKRDKVTVQNISSLNSFIVVR